MTIAQQIADQIGHKTFTMLGTKTKVADTNSLTFDIRGCKTINKICIVYMSRMDDYTIEFYKVSRADCVKVTRMEEVQVDQLHQIIEDVTGLYTRL